MINEHVIKLFKQAMSLNNGCAGRDICGKDIFITNVSDDYRTITIDDEIDYMLDEYDSIVEDDETRLTYYPEEQQYDHDAIWLISDYMNQTATFTHGS